MAQKYPSSINPLTPAQIQRIQNAGVPLFIDGAKGGHTFVPSENGRTVVCLNLPGLAFPQNLGDGFSVGIMGAFTVVGSGQPGMAIINGTATSDQAGFATLRQTAIGVYTLVGNGGGSSSGPASAITQPQVDAIAAGTTRHSTIVIAASDTIGKAGADIICTAGNAYTQIQAAITSMRGKPGRIFFLDGTYDIDNEFIVDTSWLTLEGESHGMWGNYTSTIGNFAVFPRASAPPARSGALFRQNTAGKGVWRVGTNYLDGGNRHKALNWLRLNHYGPSGTGIVLRDDTTAMTDICRFASCNIQGFGAGVDVRWDNPLIFDNNIQDTGGGAANSTLSPGGIRVRGVRGQVYDNVVFQIGGVGIWVGSYGASVHNNVVGGTNDHNIFVTSAKVKVIGNDLCNPGSSQSGGNSVDNICIGNYPETGTNANYFTNKRAEGCVIMGNTCSMVMEENNAFPVNNTGSCITVGDGGIPALGGNTDRTVVHGNTCYSSATSIAAGIYAIDVKNASTECSVTGNTVSGPWNANGTVKVGNLGTNAANNIVKDNPGSA